MSATTDPRRFHTGRTWTGTSIEDDCPCPKEPCGLVVLPGSPACDQHTFGKTMRQGHMSDQCPGVVTG